MLEKRLIHKKKLTQLSLKDYIHSFVKFLD